VKRLTFGDVVWTFIVWLAVQSLLAAVASSFDVRGVLIVLPLLALPLAAAIFFVRARIAVHRAEWELNLSAIVTRSGFRLLPAKDDAPVICLETDPSVIPAAQIEYAVENELSPDQKWRRTRQALHSRGGAMVDVVTFQSEAGEKRDVAFDVSRSALWR
jgi:hypothetical protein